LQPSWPRKWLAASGLVLSLALSQARPWLPWDRYFFDRNLALRHQVLPGQYPLMAHLSLKESDLSQWKSTRQEYDGLARLIRDCRDQGAAVIVLDLLITRGSNDDFKNLWPEVYGRSDVVLARSLTEVPRLPGASESGVATLQRDWDGLVRGYQLYYPEKNAPSLPGWPTCACCACPRAPSSCATEA
jgi:CHASE2 domain-containing sensor protein